MLCYALFAENAFQHAVLLCVDLHMLGVRVIVSLGHVTLGFRSLSGFVEVSICCCRWLKRSASYRCRCCSWPQGVLGCFPGCIPRRVLVSYGTSCAVCSRFSSSSLVRLWLFRGHYWMWRGRACLLCSKEVSPARTTFSARAIATVIRSCRSHERSRRCRRRCAAPETGCSLRSIPPQVTQKKGTFGIDSFVVVFVVVVSETTEARQCQYQQSPVPIGMGSPRWQRTLRHRGLQKLELNSGTTWRSAKNASKPPKTPPTAI